MNQTIENLETLLVRVHPDTRTSLEDAQKAGNELREIARVSRWVGPLVDKSTGKFTTEFVKHITQ